MIPQHDDELINDFVITSHPSYTYKWDINKKRSIDYTDNLEAIKQACYKIINTERYDYLIYSWNYGIELKDLFGKPLPYVYPELKRRITEALLADDRIESVENFSFSHRKGEVLTTFTVITNLGEFQMEKGVLVA